MLFPQKLKYLLIFNNININKIYEDFCNRKYRQRIYIHPDNNNNYYHLEINNSSPKQRAISTPREQSRKNRRLANTTTYLILGI